MSLGSSQDPSTCATCFASFLGVSFLLGGFALLLLSWINTREERIIMYDGAVHRWTNQARPSFATLQVTASAFSPSLGHASVRRLRMDKSEVLHWAVHDSEGGKGIEVFKPLKYVAQFSFPSYYGNATRPVPRDLLDSVPLQQDAPNATFTFNMVGAIANASSLNSISLPLFFFGDSSCQGSSSFNKVFKHPARCVESWPLLPCEAVGKLVLSGGSRWPWGLAIPDVSHNQCQGGESKWCWL